MTKPLIPDMNEWRKKRYALFNEKIDSLKDHPEYEKLRKQADDAIRYNEGFGYSSIQAAEVIKRIEEMDIAFIREWLDGKNGLKWDEYKEWSKHHQPTKKEKELPEEAKKLFSYFIDEYIEKGYLYSGSVPYDALIANGVSISAIDKLLKNGVIQKRNCDGLAYELTPSKRKPLVAKHDLCSIWYEKTGDALLPEIQTEARDAAAIPGDKSGITVSTIKNENDINKPDKMTVYSPFSVGQVIQLEYDLPRDKQWKPVGYADAILRPGGVAVGNFIVTDIYCNLLVNPQINMIELQSLDHTFNLAHPDARTMQVFEDVVLKRLKEPSLNDKIKEAAGRTDTSVVIDAKTKETSQELNF